jgi:hypothetical protein
MSMEHAAAPGTLRRAAADRVIYDSAALLTIAGIAAAGEAFLAASPVTGRSVQATIEHIASRYAVGAGGTPLPAGGMPEDVLRAGRDALLRTLAEADRAPEEAAAAVAAAKHGVEHALDLLEALPAACDDAVLVNWALFHDWSGDAVNARRAQALARAIEKRQRQRQRRRLARR